MSLDKLQTEFTQYQTAVDLPQADRVDIQWHMINQIQDMLGNYKYKHLARVTGSTTQQCWLRTCFPWCGKPARKPDLQWEMRLLSPSFIQKVTAVHSGTYHSQQFSSEMLSKAKSATRLALAATGDSWIQHDTDWWADSDVNMVHIRWEWELVKFCQYYFLFYIT